MTTEQLIRAILERAAEDDLVHDRDPQELTDEELKPLVEIVTRWLGK